MKYLILAVTLVTMLSAETIKLPKPQMAKGMPLYEALSKRLTSREFNTKELSENTINHPSP